MTPPTQGPTGSPVVECSLTRVSGHQLIPYERPIQPERVQTLYADDGTVIAHYAFSAPEWRSRIEAWKLACREHARSGGLHLVKGAEDVRCSVECSDGSTGEGVWTGSKWEWISLATGVRVL